MIDFDEVEKITLSHYENNAESFWQGTRDHDVSQNIDAFLQALSKDKPLDILDFGCGPGRDIHTFKSLGHNPIGLDGSKIFCEMAKKHSGCTVLHQSFSKLELEVNSFDGVFANASLFHVPGHELLKVLKQLHNALRTGGVLFCSNPRGDIEGWQGQRYGHYMEIKSSQVYLEKAGFKVLHHYYRPEGQPREKQNWLAIISEKLPVEA
ncbi:MAG: class I SAM-dependent methyltransferase [Proteobacteria bacterium]|nr:class I SAM-dependent methyltransferase [Pseudomonadota bacterium]NOG61660.1 class I SAM-dependent methyltransferase [Pseudomonadota bacterium]